jgi:hypothetical protein|tara:strand:+ start:335 stop:448 length:114 start_codon:yes stop_codon:yes gene_type:complete
MIETIGWMLIGVFFGLLPQICVAILSAIQNKPKTLKE